jgi:beta-phosphoglucomutase family hydrolase
MRQSHRVITPEKFDAVLFDLDGVLTETASVHAKAWKRMFDAYLQRRAADTGERFQNFEIGTDYKLYVDGKPRYEGVRSFLESRNIQLPYGDPDDLPGVDTICGLGNQKNVLTNEILTAQGARAYAGSVTLVRRLRAQGIKTAVVSSSKNAQAVIEAAHIAELFEVRIDGEVAARKHLAGKPKPDTFLKAAEELGVVPARAVVVEDAIAGVQAGRAGNFGLVIGDAAALKQNGADIVVNDLDELL